MLKSACFVVMMTEYHISPEDPDVSHFVCKVPFAVFTNYDDAKNFMMNKAQLYFERYGGHNPPPQYNGHRKGCFVFWDGGRLEFQISERDLYQHIREEKIN
jgi:hypothetical protein